MFHAAKNNVSNGESADDVVIRCQPGQFSEQSSPYKGTSHLHNEDTMFLMAIYIPRFMDLLFYRSVPSRWSIYVVAPALSAREDLPNEPLLPLRSLGRTDRRQTIARHGLFTAHFADTIQ